MNTLNLGSDEIPEKKKKSSTRNLKIALGLAAVILVPTIGSTLAGQISIAGDGVEFGQGVAATAACQPSAEPLIIVPESELITSGYFALSSVTIANINGSCSDKTFVIRLIGGANDPLVFGSNVDPVDACVIIYRGGVSASTASGACTLEPEGQAGVLVFNTVSEVDAALVFAITIESRDTVE